jgi:hypothetical protein
MKKMPFVQNGPCTRLIEKCVVTGKKGANLQNESLLVRSHGWWRPEGCSERLACVHRVGVPALSACRHELEGDVVDHDQG